MQIITASISALQDIGKRKRSSDGPGSRSCVEKDIVDLGSFRLIALNFIGSSPDPGYPATKPGDLADLCRLRARPPLLAFVHWGQEYTTLASAAQYETASALYSCGVGAIIGTHSHQASPQIEARNGGEYQVTFSIGNLLFDQKASRGSGALLELRVFSQGTFATRLVPVPNFYDFGNSKLREKQGG